MQDNIFWSVVWGIVALCVITLILVVGGIEVQSNNTMLQMVEKGVDPIKARCAVYGGQSSNAALCTSAVQIK